jgi:hypothetical protein
MGLVASLVPYSGASAATVWSFVGKCDAESRIKVGKLQDDLRIVQGTPFKCNKVLVTELSSGRKVVHFTDTGNDLIMPTGFAGSNYDRKTNPKLMFLEFNALYPPRPSALANMPPADAEGTCIFGNHELVKTVELTCTGQMVDKGYKAVYRFGFNVESVSMGQIPNM